jgi:Fur family transcriptional regulator, peroxide stress response regulator
MREAVDITNDFRHRGLRITPQRIAILQAVRSLGSHPTVEEVYQLVKQEFPTISLTTVYRTLEKLVTLNELTQINYMGNRTRFDHRLDTHQHVMCVKCREIREIEIERSCTEACIPADVKQWITITGFSLLFYGLCKNCAGSNVSEA